MASDVTITNEIQNNETLPAVTLFIPGRYILNISAYSIFFFKVIPIGLEKIPAIF